MDHVGRNPTRGLSRLGLDVRVKNPAILEVIENIELLLGFVSYFFEFDQVNFFPRIFGG